MFRLGNAATFCKEFIRLAAVDKCFKTGIPALRRGMKDARKINQGPRLEAHAAHEGHRVTEVEKHLGA